MVSVSGWQGFHPRWSYYSLGSSAMTGCRLEPTSSTNTSYDASTSRIDASQFLISSTILDFKSRTPLPNSHHLIFIFHCAAILNSEFSNCKDKYSSPRRTSNSILSLHLFVQTSRMVSPLTRVSRACVQKGGPGRHLESSWSQKLH